LHDPSPRCPLTSNWIGRLGIVLTKLLGNMISAGWMQRSMALRSKPTSPATCIMLPSRSQALPVSFFPCQNKNGAGRNRRATQPPAHFHRNPLGRSQLAIFPRCSLLTYQFRYARCYCQSVSDRLEKQPADPASAGQKACLFREQDTRSRLFALGQV
jgi:hypothetical protein